MKYKMYAVYDETAQVYSQPIMSLNDATAQRIMQNCVNNPEHQYHLNAECFTLYLIGEYDDSVGVITPVMEKKIDLFTLRPIEV